MNNWKAKLAHFTIESFFWFFGPAITISLVVGSYMGLGKGYKTLIVALLIFWWPSFFRKHFGDTTEPSVWGNMLLSVRRVYLPLVTFGLSVDAIHQWVSNSNDPLFVVLGFVAVWGLSMSIWYNRDIILLPGDGFGGFTKHVVGTILVLLAPVLTILLVNKMAHTQGEVTLLDIILFCLGLSAMVRTAWRHVKAARHIEEAQRTISADIAKKMVVVAEQFYAHGIMYAARSLTPCHNHGNKIAEIQKKMLEGSLRPEGLLMAMNCLLAMAYQQIAEKLHDSSMAYVASYTAEKLIERFVKLLPEQAKTREELLLKLMAEIPSIIEAGVSESRQ